MILHGGDVGGGGADVGDIGHSLRLRKSATAYLSKTLAAPTDGKKWVFSAFVKRGIIGAAQMILRGVDGVANANLAFDSTDDLYFGAGPTIYRRWSPLFRDPSAPYHIVLVCDTTQATEANRLLLYINGVQQPTNGTDAISQNSVFSINKANAHYIGGESSTLDGYISRVCFVDGQALAPSSFGFLNAEINEWVSKSQTEVKAVVDAGGTNSFMLEFDDGTSLTTLGYDKSAKGNNWTLNNVSLTAGATYDSMLDTPTNGYATLNPLVPYSTAGGTLTEGNLKAYTGTTGRKTKPSTIGMSSGKWYWEVTTVAPYGSASNPDSAIGIIGSGAIDYADSSLQSTGYSYIYTGNKYALGVLSSYGAAYGLNDVIGCALDMEAGTLEFFKNGVSQGVAFTGLSGTFFAIAGDGTTAVGTTYQFNFGQRPFAFTPPAGFKSLCQANLPDPLIANPESNFDVVLDTGANIKTACEAKFSSFIEWIKDRANANNHQLIDSVRGTSVVSQPNSQIAETTYTAPSGNSVGWVWKENASAGIDIVTYTGTGAVRTVAHSLGVAPSMIIAKCRNAGSTPWQVFHKSVGNTAALWLDQTATPNTNNSWWNNTSPDSANFTLGTGSYANGNGNTHVAYCFAEIEGYSKIGSYTGNGSADGTYVDCGFKPKFLMIKNVSSLGNWMMYDAVRDQYNTTLGRLLANQSNSENTVAGSANPIVDILSLGFKFRGTDSNVNTSGSTYVFFAIADVAGKFSLAR